MSLRLRGFPDHGFLVWFALVAGIVAWAAHLLFFSAIVGFVRDEGYFWLFYLGNGLCLLLALLATWLSWLLYRAGDDEDEAADTPGGRIRFLGGLGLLVNAINILLIVTEGIYIFFIPTHG
jgi:hypothetical protein